MGGAPASEGGESGGANDSSPAVASRLKMRSTMI
jgi:hypothetical protein